MLSKSDVCKYFPTIIYRTKKPTDPGYSPYLLAHTTKQSTIGYATSNRIQRQYWSSTGIISTMGFEMSLSTLRPRFAQDKSCANQCESRNTVCTQPFCCCKIFILSIVGLDLGFLMSIRLSAREVEGSALSLTATFTEPKDSITLYQSMIYSTMAFHRLRPLPSDASWP
ncbi:hypothetical protein BJX68DRAFT_90126 [Aspergillus pseudodeflectus]|uniref:Uncharacterized protein n=1 Tax=Aspergillus pseudodeflectus TaxID=176178 RepID=A0ABR4L7Z2_9EURO